MKSRSWSQGAAGRAGGGGATGQCNIMEILWQRCNTHFHSLKWVVRLVCVCGGGGEVGVAGIGGVAFGICNSAHCCIYIHTYIYSVHSPFANIFLLLLLFCVSFKLLLLLLVFSGFAVAETFQNLYINMLSRSFSIRDIR